MPTPAVFLDRDGTINEQMGYINHVSRFVMLPGTVQAVRLLNTNGYLTIVVSNQSGVARGYFPIELVDQVHRQMISQLAGQDARIDGVFFCPHHPDGVVSEYAVSCECRKPKPGLIEKARRQFDIDMSGSFVVGDQCKDIELAAQCGMPGILVRTGYGRGEIEYVLPHGHYRPVHVADDLLGAVGWILESS
jgi:D-glycero-D-manno-heptose 1,7-bisphosphate phosphatase